MESIKRRWHRQEWLTADDEELDDNELEAKGLHSESTTGGEEDRLTCHFADERDSHNTSLYGRMMENIKRRWHRQERLTVVKLQLDCSQWCRPPRVIDCSQE